MIIGNLFGEVIGIGVMSGTHIISYHINIVIVTIIGIIGIGEIIR
jgi:hypothetical protein